MAGSKKADHDALAANAEDSDHHESSGSGDEVSDDIVGDSPVKVAGEDKLAKDLADCSITPERAAQPLKSGGSSEEESDSEEMPEEPSEGQASKEPREKAAPGRPKYSEIILQTVAEAGPSRSGVSFQQIKKMIYQKFPEMADKSDLHIKNNLKRLVDTEALIQVTGVGATGSYKLPKPDKAKAGPKSKTGAATKTTSKVLPKSATAKPTETKKSTAKSPKKDIGSTKATSGAKATASKSVGAVVKSSSVRLTKINDASKAKVAAAKSPLKPAKVSEIAKPKGRPPKEASQNGAPKSPASKPKTTAPKASALAKETSTKAKASAAKSPNRKPLAVKSPKAKAVPPKSPKPRSVAPKSPGAQRAAASKSKLDDDVQKVAPGPASKRGKKL